MEKYLYLTSDEYKALVCISGTTPVTGFSPEREQTVEERRMIMLKLFNKGLVVNAGDSFAVCRQWQNAFSVIHSAAFAVRITVKDTKVPDILIYAGKPCVLLENVSEGNENEYRLSEWEVREIPEILAERGCFPDIRLDPEEAVVYRRRISAPQDGDGSVGELTCNITKYRNGYGEAVFSAGLYREELIWYVETAAQGMYHREMADAETAVNILRELLGGLK